MKPKPDNEEVASQDVVLYIAATLNVHEASQNPLECGELSKQGIEQLEAFLWAIDQVNLVTQLGIVNNCIFVVTDYVV
jgi:hypothetical protein